MSSTTDFNMLRLEAPRELRQIVSGTQATCHTLEISGWTFRHETGQPTLPRCVDWVGRRCSTRRAPSQVAACTGKARRLPQGKTTIGGHPTDMPSEGNERDRREHPVTTRELWALPAEGNEPDPEGGEEGTGTAPPTHRADGNGTRQLPEGHDSLRPVDRHVRLRTLVER
jgi:hypothetical protein